MEKAVVLFFIFTLFVQNAITEDIIAQGWVSEDTNIIFPEQDLLMIQERENNGACFVGGGNRAFVAGAGQLAGLNRLGLIEKIRYISGTTVLIPTYALRQVKPKDSEFLFMGMDPAQLTLDRLDQDPNKDTILYPPFIARDIDEIPEVVNSQSLSGFLTAPYNVNETSQIWMRLMHQVYFETVGLKGDEIMALNDDHVSEIKQRNPMLEEDMFIMPVEKSPFVILGATIISPAELAPISEDPEEIEFTRVEFTPLYSGVPLTKEVTYTDNEGNTQTMTLGGFIESFAFSGIPTVPTQSFSSGSQYLNVTLYNSTAQNVGGFPVRFLAGVASRYASPLLATDEFDPLVTHDLLPRARMFPLSDLSQIETMLLGRGSSSENTGIIGLIQRRVEYVVVFDNTNATDIEEDFNLKSLFGVDLENEDVNNVRYFYANNHVLDEEQYQEIVDQIKEKIDAGEPAIAMVNVTTVKNDWWGVEEGFTFQLTWVYLHAHEKWMNLLPQETKDLIESQEPALENFPYYESDAFVLTTEQINLLAELTNYVVRSQPDLFMKAFGIEEDVTPPESSAVSISTLFTVALTGGLMLFSHFWSHFF